MTEGGFDWEDRDSDYKVNKAHTVAKGKLEQLSEIYSQNLESDFCNEEKIEIKIPEIVQTWREYKIKNSKVSGFILHVLAEEIGEDPEKISSKTLKVKYTDYPDFPIMIKEPGGTDEYFFIAPILKPNSFVDPRPWIIWKTWESAEKPEEVAP